MFYNQPLADRFGTALVAAINDEKWNRIEFAVAWARRSGTQHVLPAFKSFLGRGGFAQLTVGVDIENTSAEGLEDFLSLQNDGTIETYIHHNEAATTFHPKVYLLRNENDARLIVGSNNLTGAGLFTNTEAGLQLDAPLTDPLIQDARTALAAWRDPDSGLAKRLDALLLNDLVSLGYVFPEAELRKRRKSSDDQSKKKRPDAASALFKARKYASPPVIAHAAINASVSGTVLLMRVRRASATARRTQIQVPKAVLETNFFKGVDGLVSAHDGRTHGINAASARGSVNTFKAEIPEIEPMGDPVLRLERAGKKVVYQAFDGLSILGKPIHTALMHGFDMTPPVTHATIANHASATWWRFI